MPDFLYRYPPLLRGTLIKRYKRFFADIELDTGELITAHCPNTGPMTSVSTVGSPVQVSQSTNPKRKLAYTWELIEVQDHEPTWVGVNTAMPNQVTRLLLEQRLVPQLSNYEALRSEVCYGQEKSRVDFVLTGASATSDPLISDPLTYVEVKSTTWLKGRCALFPDTVTTRGQKHIRELRALLPDARVCMLYFINRADCTAFAPGDEADPVYGQLLREAVQAGLEVYPCRFEVSPEGIRYLGLAELKL
ncbi:MAG: DNA/RNA nuclease SfsA [Thermosynechococcaceae cyanobacterium MS004]|nr:DNA/RNA nuclease SfsA [Thermosynechococcaceae cyanobacterium MS004]